jgi:hypothetical protein
VSGGADACESLEAAAALAVSRAAVVSAGVVAGWLDEHPTRRRARSRLEKRRACVVLMNGKGHP